MISKAMVVYNMKNIISGKQYIGSCNNFLRRQGEHMRDLKRNVHSNKLIQSEYNSFGKLSFSFEVIHEIPYRYSINADLQKMLFEIEKKFIALRMPEYNVMYKPSEKSENPSQLVSDIIEMDMLLKLKLFELESAYNKRMFDVINSLPALKIETK